MVVRSAPRYVPHWITSSARIRTDSGIVSPSAFAASHRLILSLPWHPHPRAVSRVDKYVYYAYPSCVGFQWDDAKEEANSRKHGVDFDETATTFYDPLALVQLDEAHSEAEERYVLLGRSEGGRLLVTVFTERGEDIRVISSRRATRREVKEYEERI